MPFDRHCLTHGSLDVWRTLLMWSRLRTFIDWLNEAFSHMRVQHIEFWIVSGLYGFVCTRSPFEVDLFVASHSFKNVVLTTEGSLYNCVDRLC